MHKFLSSRQQKIVLAALLAILSAAIPGSPVAIGVVLDAISAVRETDEQRGCERPPINTTEGAIDVTQ